MKGRFSLTKITENIMQFEQLRIPVYDSRGKAMDTHGFVKELQQYLKGSYGIDSKLVMRGLGEAHLILGEK